METFFRKPGFSFCWWPGRPGEGFSKVQPNFAWTEPEKKKWMPARRSRNSRHPELPSAKRWKPTLVEENSHRVHWRVQKDGKSFSHFNYTQFRYQNGSFLFSSSALVVVVPCDVVSGEQQCCSLSSQTPSCGCAPVQSVRRRWRELDVTWINLFYFVFKLFQRAKVLQLCTAVGVAVGMCNFKLTVKINHTQFMFNPVVSRKRWAKICSFCRERIHKLFILIEH